MYKFIVIKDPHFRFGFDKPQGRTDEFENQIDAKIEFLCKYAEDNGVDALVIPGDLTDKKNPSMYSWGQGQKNIDRFRNLSKSFDNVMFSYGNHDLLFSAEENKNQAVLNQAVLEIKNLNEVSEIPYTPNGVFDSSDCPIFVGVNYQKSIELLSEKLKEMNTRLKKIKKDNPGRKVVCLVHEHVIPFKEKLKYVNWMTYHDLLEFDNVDIWCFGHLHKGFETEFVNNKNGDSVSFVNPWSFTRLARDHYVVDSEHKPEMVVVTINDGTLVSHEKITIPHEHFSRAFITSELNISRSFNEQLDAFATKLKSKVRTISLEDINDEIKDSVVDYINQAEKIIEV